MMCAGASSMFEATQIIVDPRRVRWDNREALQFENGQPIQLEGNSPSTPLLEV